MFLDEPTAGVDPGVRREFWSLIRTLARQGVTVFVTTHYMDEAEYCGRIGLMADGTLRALDTPSALKSAWVPGRILAFEGPGVGLGVEAVRRLAGVIAVEAFGTSWHVRFEPALLAEAELLTTFRAAGAGELAVEPAEATLEDVFLAVVARKDDASAEVAT